MVASIPDLEAKQDITAEELIETITDYASGNKAIIAHVVIDLSQRVGWHSRNHLKLVRAVSSGMKAHQARGRLKEAREYEKVLEYLKSF